MKHRAYLISFYAFVVLCVGGLQSCDKFLDELPDDRIELDSEEKISKLLVTAYPDYHDCLITELMSDNVDDYLGEANLYGQRYTDQYAMWEDGTETDNYDNPYAVWSAHYAAIASANQALQSIEELGSPSSLNQAKGEALIIRAYCHFVLANLFCLPYNPDTASSVLGIPYANEVENTLTPSYDRGSLASVYEQIERDIEEGLPLCGDSYTVPKYRFNKKAAYGFASRFYLFAQQYDKVIECANMALGTDPRGELRNWAAIAEKTYDVDVYKADYISASSQCNYLLATGYSNIGVVMGPYSYCKRFTTTNITDKEILEAPGVWGAEYGKDFEYRLKVAVYNNPGVFCFVLVPKFPQMFQYTDAVQGIGYRHSIFTLMTAEEVLLNRAEAYILKGDYDSAIKDMRMWVDSRFAFYTMSLTKDNINRYYASLPYYEPLSPTTKHRLHPQGFEIQSTEMENMIHCLLQIRRINFIHDGMRWHDCKRYGIDIYRRLIDDNAKLAEVTETLAHDDLRRAVQIPFDIISAGLEANPR